MHKILCLFGIHCWNTVSMSPCKAKSYNTFTCEVTSGVPVVAKIQQCGCCGKRRGILTDGSTSSKCDVDFLMSSVMGRVNNG